MTSEEGATPLGPEERERLLAAAREAARAAYAPYSGFKVGAALLTRGGRLYTGCNVENASYGLSLCAERAALAAAVRGEGGGRLKVRALAVVSEPAGPCPPCGACRQVLMELAPEALILFQDREGPREIGAAQLLPHSFTLAPPSPLP
ncbi:MAG: cytidine deaminase [Deltaproteobacteria bacterium]|nr:cytidine deaminase [Deltaproteobacteria bacterium]MBM4286429.1 cytidine deaminase [Deltaproteobacteria bacterium]